MTVRNSEFGVRNYARTYRYVVGADALVGPWTCARFGYAVGATLVVARRGTVLISESLRRIRREMDILSLCLSKEKEPKRNDTREGKIAFSSPPETHPNSNAQEGRSPLGSPPARCGFARGFYVSQVSPPGIRASPSGGGVCAADGRGATPPGGDKPRPYMRTEGFRFSVGARPRAPRRPRCYGCSPGPGRIISIHPPKGDATTLLSSLFSLHSSLFPFLSSLFPSPVL